MTKISLIGLGNILMKDEGIGVHTVNALRKRYTFSPDVEIVDGGTLGLDLLPFLEEGGRVVFVDAVDFGKGPGHIDTIEGEEILTFLHSGFSAHHVGLSDLLLASRMMGILPGEICLIGMQPGCVDCGLDMTEAVRLRKEEVIDLILRKLQQWGVTCALRSL